MTRMAELYTRLRTPRQIRDKNGKLVIVNLSEDSAYFRKLNENDNIDKLRNDNRLYRENDQVINKIVGTAMAATVSLWLLLLGTSLPWTWFKGKITDGYWMCLLSPFILTNWIVMTVLYLPLVILLSGLVIVAGYWTVLIEMPAGYMNKESVSVDLSFLASNPDIFTTVMAIVSGVAIVATIIFTCASGG